MTSPTPRLDAELRARELHDDFKDFTPEQIRNMPASEFARLSGRHFGPGAGTPAPGLDPVLVDYMEKTPEPEPAPVSFADMTIEEYAVYRAQNGIGQSQKEGKGIFDGVSSRSEAYTNAARAQAGRTAWVGSNVEEAPKIARPNLVGVDRPNLDARPLSERFGTASNAYRPQ